MEFLFSSFLLGLSTGVYCLFYCVPFIAPIMVAEERKRRESFFLLIKFITGRFFGYLIFGAFVGFWAEKFDNKFLTKFLEGALFLLAIILIFHSFSFVKRNSFCLRLKKFNPHFPFLIGFLTGINICPPFLISVINVFLHKGLFFGVTYFFFFFLGTSLYFLPLFFLGFLSKLREFQFVGRISSFLVGILFFFYSLYSIFKGVSLQYFNL